MKPQNNNSSPLPTILLTLLLTGICVFGLIACKSGELSRSKAAEMIAASPGFKTPASVPLTQTMLDEGDPDTVEVTGNDDTPEKAVERAIGPYADSSPQFALAMRLGIINPGIVTTETSLPRKRFLDDAWEWKLKVNPSLNDQGRKLWADYGLSVNENSIPVARRASPEVTGITKSGENEVTVEYKYIFEPNEFGKYLDPSTAEFKSLPTEIQDSVQGKLNKYGQPRVRIDASWSTPRSGNAVFQRYDDGWRLISAR